MPGAADPCDHAIGMDTAASGPLVAVDAASRRAPSGWAGAVDPVLSIARGPTDVPLLDQTIGERLRETIERFGAREALVDPARGYRATWSALGDEVDRCARGLMARGVAQGERVGIWAPNRPEWVVVQFATARIGAILVNVNPAYKATELEYALQRAGVSTLILSHGFRQTDYEELLAGVRDRCPALRDVLVLESDWVPLLAAGDDVSDAGAGGPGGEPDAGRADQHPVHVRHDGLPQGRDPLAPQHPQQRVLHRPAAAVHGARPRLRAGALLPLLRHGARHAGVHDLRGDARRPGRGVRARRGARDRRGGAVHLALRRADDVHRGAGGSALRARSTSRACARGSWPARRAPSRR